MAEIRELAHGLDRLKDKRLESQRFVASAQKADDLNKLALGAKLDRALGRRMREQDAVMRVRGMERGMGEKSGGLKVSVREEKVKGLEKRSLSARV